MVGTGRFKTDVHGRIMDQRGWVRKERHPKGFLIFW